VPLFPTKIKINKTMMKLTSHLLFLIVLVDNRSHGFTIKSTFTGVPMVGPIGATTRLSMNIENVQTKENIRVGVIGTFLHKSKGEIKNDEKDSWCAYILTHFCLFMFLML
jgi:hypothetical protein